MTRYAELHCHTSFSMLDGASSADDLVERAVELGLTGLAVTDHQGLYGVVRFATAAEEAGIHPVIGVEIELVDTIVPDPAGIVGPARRPRVRGGRSRIAALPAEPLTAIDGLPARPRPVRARLPGHREAMKEDVRGIGERQRGPHLVLLARDATGYRSLCRLVSRANLAGTKAMPRFTHDLLAADADGLVALSGCRDGEIARRLLVGDRAGASAAAERLARIFGAGVPGLGGFLLELGHHLRPDDDLLVEETVRLAAELGCPIVVTNDVHHARPEDRELGDVLTAIRHGRTLDDLADLRRPDGESYLKSGDELDALATGLPPTAAGAWREGLANAADVAAACSVDLGFERYRFPGFAVPRGETAFSYLESLCHEGARRRYHPMTPAVVRQLAHELEVVERTGLAEFFLICWDLMRFAKEQGIPAQGRGSAADSIVAYVLGITRVDPIRHNLLFERFINEGRTTYPDVDIDFSSERREEVIQYVYERYGVEHTGMVCNVVTYRARSAVREVGYALGFPRPLVDRVAKALETYDSVMVRRDLEAEGGFGSFFAVPGGGADGAARAAGERGLVDGMGQLNHARGGRIPSGSAGARSEGRGVARVEGPAQAEAEAPVEAEAEAPARAEAPVQAEGPARAEAPVPAEAPVQAEAEVPAPAEAPARAEAPGVSPAMLASVDPGVSSAPGATHVPLGEPVHARGELIRDRADARLGGAAARETSSTGGIAPSAAGMACPNHAGDLRASDPRASDLRASDPPASDPRAADPLAPLGSGPLLRGGPGDSPASAALFAAERRRAEAREGWRAPKTGQPGTAPNIGQPGTAPNIGQLGTAPNTGQPGTTPNTGQPGTAPNTGQPGTAAAADALEVDDPRAPRSSVARLQPEPAPGPRRGSTKGMSDWDRWLELCARIDGFPRHLSIHSGGMLVTAAPLIDIAPLERATMPGRVVVQYDKRDVETLRLIKLDLLGLGMLAAIDETLKLIEADCAVCVDLDRLPEDIPDVFRMLQAADTVGVFQVESRAQMQTLPKSRPANLDDLVVEVAIIRPGPIQGNAVHPYLRRKQGLEPVAYLHPSLEPILRDTLGVILYQEQVMQIAISVAGFSAGESDGFRRAMGTWRSTREMEKLHARFVDGCRTVNGLTDEQAEELFRRVAAFASFGFAKSHAAAFARTAYESAFLKLFYPAHFLAGLVNAQPMGFYPVEVLVNDAKRHGVSVLPVDVNASSWRTTTEWVGIDGPLPPGAGIDRRPSPVASSACVVPSAEVRGRWAAESASGWGVRLGLHLVNGIGEEVAGRLDAELARGPYRSLADVVERAGLSEEVLERLIRAGGLDSLGRPRRELLWQLREVAGATKGRIDGRPTGGTRAAGRAAGRPMDLRLPPTEVPALPALEEIERLGDAYATLSLDAKRQVVGLFRPALDRLGAITNAELADRSPGRVLVGGLVVTRQHPMTARGTVFLALEDETGMVNVTLWPDAWARLRGVVRRHALLLVDGTLQREGNVVNVVARDVRPLPDATADVGGPARPTGVRQMGMAGMRRR